MRSIVLGLRLAVTPAARQRTTLTVLSVAVGCLVLLIVAAYGRSELEIGHAGLGGAEVERLILVIGAAVALPIGVLVATVGRLSASLRDRRLANLRLMGLSPLQSRLVAGSEVGIFAVVGAALGAVAFWLTRPALTMLYPDPTEQVWRDQFLAPSSFDQVVILTSVPLLAVAVAVFPQRGRTEFALARAQRADRAAPGPLRVLPLVLGIGCAIVLVAGESWLDRHNDVTSTLMVGGLVLTGTGLVLVVPVFARLLARILLRRGSGASTLVAARRLEAQPAGVTRVVGALLVGLFLVTGAHFVISVFEATPEYDEITQQLRQDERVRMHDIVGWTTDEVVAELAKVPEVHDVVVAPTLATDCDQSPICASAVVADCETLARLAPGLTGCQEGRAMSIEARPQDEAEGQQRTTLSWRAGEPLSAVGPGDRSEILATTPADLSAIGGSPSARRQFNRLTGASVVVPPTLVRGEPREDTKVVVAIGPPGRSMSEALAEESVAPMTTYDEYDLVIGLRRITWSVAGLILGLGLFTFGVASIDRITQRRRELVSLQLVGLPRALLRRSQWIEALVPTAGGAVLAVCLGIVAGATYLALIDEVVRMPWDETAGLLLIALAGSIVIAGLTVVACNLRIRPEDIRVE